MNDLEIFNEAYPEKPAKFSIPLQNQLMHRDSLKGLIRRIDPDLLEYNRGDLPVSIAPDSIPDLEIPPSQIIDEIGTCNSWMVIRNIEKDADYCALVDSIMHKTEPYVLPKTGETLRREAFIFISSPNSVTPFHFDEEHNILMQIEGKKVVHVFSQHDRDLASQEDLEKFHSGGHRNLPLKEEHNQKGTAITLTPGDCLYIPPLAPHWVQVLNEGPALSLSITWRSQQTMRALYLHQINHKRRQNGQSPPFPGQAPLRDQLKIWQESALRRLKNLRKANS